MLLKPWPPVKFSELLNFPLQHLSGSIILTPVHGYTRRFFQMLTRAANFKTKQAHPMPSCKFQSQLSKSFVKLTKYEEIFFILGADIPDQEQRSTNHKEPMHLVSVFLETPIRDLWIAVVFTFVRQRPSVCRSCFTASGISVRILIEN